MHLDHKLIGAVESHAEVQLSRCCLDDLRAQEELAEKTEEREDREDAKESSHCPAACGQRATHSGLVRCAHDVTHRMQPQTLARPYNRVLP